MAIPGGEDWDELHLTLAYLGKRDRISDQVIAAMQETCDVFARSNAPLEGRIAGLGMFDATENSDGKDVIYAKPDVPGIMEFREQLARALTATGAVVASNFAFTPHMTLAYVEPGEFPEASVQRLPVRFDTITFSVGGDRTDYPLSGTGGAAPPSPANGVVSDAELAKALRVLDLVEQKMKEGPAALASPFSGSGAVTISRSYEQERAHLAMKHGWTFDQIDNMSFAQISLALAQSEVETTVSKIDEFHDPHSGRFARAPGGAGHGAAHEGAAHEAPTDDADVHAPHLANPSKAVIPEKAEGIVSRFFGRPIAKHEIASMIGAPDDAEVSMHHGFHTEPHRRGDLDFNFEHSVNFHWVSPKGDAQRTFHK